MANPRLAASAVALLFLLAVAVAPAAAADPSPAPSPAATASPAPSPSASPTPSASPGLLATTTTLSAGPTMAIAGSTVTLTAVVVPSPGGGTVLFTNPEVISDDPAAHVVGQVAIDPDSGIATFSLTVHDGVYGFVATFSGYGGFLGSTSTEVVVPSVFPGTGTQTSLVITTPTIEAGVATAVANVKVTPLPPAPGVIAFTTGSELLGFQVLDEATGTAVGSISISRPGTYQIWATYLGEPEGIGGSQSLPVPVVVTPDVGVHPVDTGVSATVFYPAKDGYRDTVDIKGTLLDRARVSIAIYSVATKKKVRTVELGTQLDQYSWTWNGRSNSGALQPAGKYRVVQSFKDAAGHKATATAYTTISPKKLVWTTKTVVRNGDDVDKWDASEFAMVSLAYSQFTHGVYVYGNVYDSWAWVRYDFKLPAAIEYGKVTFAVLGETPAVSTNDGPAWLSFWDFSKGEEGDLRATDSDFAWYSISGPATSLMSSSREVRGFVSVFGKDEGVFDVEKVKLTYKYAVLQ